MASSKKVLELLRLLEDVPADSKCALFTYLRSLQDNEDSEEPLPFYPETEIN